MCFLRFSVKATFGMKRKLADRAQRFIPAIAAGREGNRLADQAFQIVTASMKASAMRHHILLASTLTLALGLAACGGGEETQTPAEETAAAPAPETPAEAAPGEPEVELAEAPESTGKVIPLTPEGWGPLIIGMSRDEVTEAAGEDSHPELVGGPDPESCDEYRPEETPEGMMVMLESGVLTRISVAGESPVVTEWNIGLGADATKVKETYPDAVITPHKYQDAPAEYITVWSTGGSNEPYIQNPSARGIRYEIGDDGKVMAIHAGGPSIQYVEGCL